MSKILTAEEAFNKFEKTVPLLDTDDNGGFFESKVIEFAIEFAKMHVTAALQQAHVRHQLSVEDMGFTLDAYPLENIK